LIGLHLLAVLATTAAAWLGLWQYDAWQASRDEGATDLADAEPKLLENVMSSDDPFPGDAIGQPVRFAGKWVDDSSFLVADRELEGRPGYWVVTPVATCRGGCEISPAMLVVRGWTSQPGDIPDPPAGRVRVTGWLQPPDGSGRPDPNPDDDLLPELRIADAIQRVEPDLYGAYVIADELAPTGGTTGLEPVTTASLPEPDTFTAVRNLLYAFEWWVFGGFALFVWWRWFAEEVREAGAAPTSGSERRSTAEPASLG